MDQRWEMYVRRRSRVQDDCFWPEPKMIGRFRVTVQVQESFSTERSFIT